MKYLVVTLSDGRIMGYPAEIVAKSYAEYYSFVDVSTSFESEYNYVLNDKCDLLDWSMNNMNIEKDVENWVQLDCTPKQMSKLIKDAMENNTINIQEWSQTLTKNEK